MHEPETKILSKTKIFSFFLKLVWTYKKRGFAPAEQTKKERTDSVANPGYNRSVFGYYFSNT